MTMTAAWCRLMSAICLLGALGSAQAEPIRLGDGVPDHVGVDADRVPVRLSAHAGKVRMLVFWASWCPHCMKELPVVSEIARIAGPDRLRVIAINTEDRRVFRKTAALIEQLGLVPAHDGERSVQASFGTQSLPLTVIVGCDDRVAYLRSGYSEAALEGLISQTNQALAACASPAGESQP